MEWPAQSPDLNPIDNRPWSVLDCQLRDRKVSIKDEFFTARQWGGNAFPDEYLIALVIDTKY